MQSEFKDIKKILIIKLRNIGDVLLTVPTIRAVRETFPDAYIAVLVNKGTEEMLTENPLLDAVITFDRSVLKFPLYQRIRNEIQFAKQIRAIGFDMAIDMTSGDRAAIYSYLCGARYRIAYDPQKKGFWGKSYFYTHLGKNLEGKNHMVLQNLHLVRQFGMNTANLNVDIYIPKNDEDSAERILEGHGIERNDFFIHIHPTARWLFKCWRDESMAEIIDFCEECMGIKVVVTSGPDKKEMDKITTILGLVKSSPVNLAGTLTLKQLAVVSKRAILFFGIDTAPMHIAAAVGTPVITLFGPTGSYDWGPWGERHLVIEEPIHCRPCKKGSCEGVLLRDCMDSIKPEKVKRAIETTVSYQKKVFGRQCILTKKR